MTLPSAARVSPTSTTLTEKHNRRFSLVRDNGYEISKAPRASVFLAHLGQSRGALPPPSSLSPLELLQIACLGPRLFGACTVCSAASGPYLSPEHAEKDAGERKRGKSSHSLKSGVNMCVPRMKRSAKKKKANQKKKSFRIRFGFAFFALPVYSICTVVIREARLPSSWTRASQVARA